MAKRAANNDAARVKKRGKASNINEHGVLLVPPPKSVSNKDHMQRLNYLFQASIYHTMIGDNDETHALSRMYLRNLDLIQKKTKSSLTPGMKRQICKHCHRVQIPMKTQDITIVNESKNQTRRSQVLELTCRCGSKKRFPYGRDPTYKTHAEKSSIIYIQK
ncbi:LAFA_0D08020g1_1 [Lachancea sp. 'fantastica']|nr:LAFA_0D08020g1_1 [Lachancea sp. 'fantastica']